MEKPLDIRWSRNAELIANPTLNSEISRISTSSHIIDNNEYIWKLNWVSITLFSPLGGRMSEPPLCGCGNIRTMRRIVDTSSLTSGVRGILHKGEENAIEWLVESSIVWSNSVWHQQLPDRYQIPNITLYWYLFIHCWFYSSSYYLPTKKSTCMYNYSHQLYPT